MNKLSILATATMMALGLSSAADAGGRPDLVKQDLQRGKQYAAGQIIVQYSSFATEKTSCASKEPLAASRIDVLGRKGRLNLSGDIELVQFAAGTTMQSIAGPAEERSCSRLRRTKLAGSSHGAHPTTRITPTALCGACTAAPPHRPIPYGSGAGSAWVNGANCSSVVVGIIDEGMMITHPDLAANVYKNPGETAGNGRDDDGNGLVDDVYGWDFASNDNTVFDGASDDHGTHVAGTIGGVGGNGVGVAGVCHQVKLMSAKFLGSRGGTTANAIKAVDYFTNLKAKGVTVVATNNSWGGGGFSQGFADAIERANSAGILFITAAGNDGTDNDATPSYPSGYASDEHHLCSRLGRYR